MDPSDSDFGLPTDGATSAHNTRPTTPQEEDDLDGFGAAACLPNHQVENMTQDVRRVEPMDDDFQYDDAENVYEGYSDLNSDSDIDDFTSDEEFPSDNEDCMLPQDRECPRLDNRRRRAKSSIPNKKRWGPLSKPLNLPLKSTFRDHTRAYPRLVPGTAGHNAEFETRREFGGSKLFSAALRVRRATANHRIGFIRKDKSREFSAKWWSIPFVIGEVVPKILLGVPADLLSQITIYLNHSVGSFDNVKDSFERNALKGTFHLVAYVLVAVITLLQMGVDVSVAAITKLSSVVLGLGIYTFVIGGIGAGIFFAAATGALPAVALGAAGITIPTVLIFSLLRMIRSSREKSANNPGMDTILNMISETLQADDCQDRLKDLHMSDILLERTFKNSDKINKKILPRRRHLAPRLGRTIADDLTLSRIPLSAMWSDPNRLSLTKRTLLSMSIGDIVLAAQKYQPHSDNGRNYAPEEIEAIQSLHYARLLVEHEYLKGLKDNHRLTYEQRCRIELLNKTDDELLVLSANQGINLDGVIRNLAHNYKSLALISHNKNFSKVVLSHQLLKKIRENEGFRNFLYGHHAEEVVAQDKENLDLMYRTLNEAKNGKDILHLANTGMPGGMPTDNGMRYVNFAAFMDIIVDNYTIYKALPRPTRAWYKNGNNILNWEAEGLAAPRELTSSDEELFDDTASTTESRHIGGSYQAGLDIEASDEDGSFLNDNIHPEGHPAGVQQDPNLGRPPNLGRRREPDHEGFRREEEEGSEYNTAYVAYDSTGPTNAGATGETEEAGDVYDDLGPHTTEATREQDVDEEDIYTAADGVTGATGGEGQEPNYAKPIKPGRNVEEPAYAKPIKPGRNVEEPTYAQPIKKDLRRAPEGARVEIEADQHSSSIDSASEDEVTEPNYDDVEAPTTGAAQEEVVYDEVEDSNTTESTEGTEPPYDDVVASPTTGAAQEEVVYDEVGTSNTTESTEGTEPPYDDVEPRLHKTEDRKK